MLDELVAYFGDGNRSAYLRATLKVMKSIMIADQLREAAVMPRQTALRTSRWQILRRIRAGEPS